MKLITYIVALPVMILLSCCGINSWDVSRYKNKFESNKESFDKLVSLMKKEKLEVSSSIRESELSNQVQDLLNDLKINRVNVSATLCEGMVTYQFETDWSGIATLYFSRETCNKEQTEKGYHFTSGNIEIWGMGEDWLMMIDHDFI
jgi:hypothetical protein